ncbi:mycothiol synthase [Isoptericola hypogeus]|uniref:Mycothiol acetyltransferase n=1 Tax=Isoptericola hypogeus TaxID=300179 RepID=A0ABP4V5S2_9MICO
MRTGPPLQIGPLDPAAQDAVRALAAQAAAHDGVAPLSEQPLLRLGTDAEWLTHVVAHDKHGATVGYLQVDRGGDVASAELVVHPDHRRQHTGSMLLRTAERDARLPMVSGAPGQRGIPLRVWAHGDLPAARAFAAGRGYEVVRELLLLAAPLTPSDAGEPAQDDAGPADVVPTSSTGAPAGLRVRTFRPGADDEAWVRLNARAFADHPEQGRLTVADLRDRQREPWFDPAGFFLVETTDAAGPGGEPGDQRSGGHHPGDPVAYLWTKIEPAGPGAARDGEIYAVGVDPTAQGRGLGRMLTAHALAHLAGSGCDRAVLYVDGDNTAARATYAGAGFEQAAVDVQYAPVAS